MQMKLFTTSAAFALVMATAPAVMAQNANGMGSSVQSTTVDRSSAIDDSGMARSHLGMSDQDRASASTAAVGQPMTASGTASAQSNSSSESVPGTFGNPVTPATSLGFTDQDRATTSEAAVGQPLPAGSTASKQSFAPTASVIGEGAPGPGVKMPSAMLVPPRVS
ncbi:hypothetical protein SAMN07250955_11446 [Arboricoccus pini]|uniref:Uncharacterized protein n=1 Tax=Arboricoccus pini TaxID=1963835 RepID=A0A212RTG0_9PROT|nr:hypothetical protein [Arboricoccus pini]SNB75968.1 hypothetical protein SAMN07250955_11446 [Arboricoccus pini]